MEHLRRTMMFLLASNPGMLKDAIIHGADSIMFDLEDAVLLAEKDISRFLIFQAVKTFDSSSTETAVCINLLNAGGIDGVYAVVRASIGAIRLPKMTCTQDVLSTEEAILEAEKACGREPGSTQMMVAIEDPRGILDTVTIVHSSERLIGIALGFEDYAIMVKTKRYADRSGEEVFFARSMIVYAARTAGVAALDAISVGVNNMEALRKKTESVRQLGSDEKSVTHPRQIAMVNSVYTLSQKGIDNAFNIFRAIEEANAKGFGAVALNGKMIDKPFVERAKRAFTLAEVAGVYIGPEGQEG